MSHLLNCLSSPNVAENRLAWRNTDGNNKKHIWTLPGQVSTHAETGLDPPQKKSSVLVEVHLFTATHPLMSPPGHCSYSYPLSLLQSFPIQWITAISSETTSYCNKTFDLNTPTPLTNSTWHPCKTKPIFKICLTLLFYFLTSHSFLNLFSSSSCLYYSTETNNLSLSEIIYLWFDLFIIYLLY